MGRLVLLLALGCALAQVAVALYEAGRQQASVDLLRAVRDVVRVRSGETVRVMTEGDLR